jgi:hypothetical protein
VAFFNCTLNTLRTYCSLQGPEEIDDEWFGELWMHQFPCSDSSNVSCALWESLNQSKVPMVWPWQHFDRVYDGVGVFAHAINSAINQTCPDAFLKSPKQREQLDQCLNGHTMLKYLKVCAEF